MSDNISRFMQKWALDAPLFENHMSFIVGPRQTGKTTLVKQYLEKIIPSEAAARYFLWDSRKIRLQLKENPYFFETLERPNSKTPLAFDEIHKMSKWKSYLKGAYDIYRNQFQFIVTGSGRLDTYQRGGDSLAGRYDTYFSFPLTPGEVKGFLPADELTPANILSAPAIDENLMQQWEVCSGFPEPFLKGSATAAMRWWDQYQVRVVEEDVRDLSRIESLDRMKDLLILMPERIASPLSINNIAEDLHCAFPTAKRYIELMNRVFFTFHIPPYSQKISRAIKKEKKAYFYFHSASENPGCRFENMVALLLLKWCAATTERGIGKFDLHYVRDQDRREVDFLITLRNKPYLLIEAKHSETKLTSSLQTYCDKLGVPGLQVVRQPNITMSKPPNAAIVSIHHLAACTG